MVDKEGKEFRIPVNVKADDSVSHKADSGTDSDAESTKNGPAVTEKPHEEPESDEDFLKRTVGEMRQNPESCAKADEVIQAVSRASESPNTAWVDNRAETAKLIVELAREAYENRDKWVRSVAELENFKKRTTQERSKLLKYGNEHLLRDLLPIVDNMERAVEAAEKAGEKGSIVEGVKMIAQMLVEILNRHGAEPVDALGKPFDPNFHEALTMAPVAEIEPNTVIEQLEKGYTLHDRLLRPAKVVVSAEENKGDRKS